MQMPAVLKNIDSNAGASDEISLTSGRGYSLACQGSSLGERIPVPNIKNKSTLDKGEDRLLRLVEMLGLEIAPEDLETLSMQLRLLEALEQDELQDYAPILKMDADWHD